MSIIRPQEYAALQSGVATGKIERMLTHISDDNRTGATQTLDYMKTIARGNYPCRNEVAAKVANILQHANARSPYQKIIAITNYVRSIMVYVKDPPDRELLKSPCAIYEEINSKGRAEGDCDDMSIMLASLFHLAGLRTGYMAVSNLQKGKHPDPPLDHVMAIVQDTDSGKWLTVDLVAGQKDWRNHASMIEYL